MLKLRSFTELTQFNYFGSDSREESKTTNFYKEERDFAFFFVNFGISMQDYLNLTETQKAFIMKEFETKTVQNNTFIRNAVYNAISNALRKKGGKFIELFKKQTKQLNEEEKHFAKYSKEIIIEIEEKNGKSWVDKIYQENNINRPRKGGE